jgi:integrase/recombinase XerD
MFTVYRRHNPEKCRFTERAQNKCKCPISVDGTLATGKRLRKTLKTRDWTRAQQMVRLWETSGSLPKAPIQITIEEWRDKFLENGEARHLTDSTLRLYRLLFKQLIAFATDRGFSLAMELDLPFLSDFRASWTKISPLTAVKRLERLRSIYKFAAKRKFVEENYALDLETPKVDSNPTLPFSEDQMKKILKAAESDKVDSRAKAFILTMRYSGLRISDVATLRVDSLNGDRLKLYQAKTKKPVSVKLPDLVVESLRAVEHKNKEFFFWSGKSKTTSITGFWRARIADVFEEAKIEDGHTHRFRDTFAVWWLERGLSLENVSRLLGHKSIKVTQKHYDPWVESRQNSLDKDMEKVMQS